MARTHSATEATAPMRTPTNSAKPSIMPICSSLSISRTLRISCTKSQISYRNVQQNVDGFLWQPESLKVMLKRIMFRTAASQNSYRQLSNDNRI